jgi:hypothetical protein
MYSRKTPAYIDEKDPRYSKHKKVFEENGIWPDELWNLDSRIAEFLGPRLKMMAENCGSFPHTLTAKTISTAKISTKRPTLD